jgi:predicted TIM-barrel fold metal-dependent hydrolase
VSKIVAMAALLCIRIRVFGISAMHRDRHSGSRRMVAGHTHISASFMVDPLGLNLIEQIGVDKVMWSSDYPHNKSTFGYSEKSLTAVVEAVGPDNVARIVSGNIKKFLGV